MCGQSFQVSSLLPQMELHLKQEEVVRDKHRFRVLNWGRKSGKTEIAIEELIGFAIVPSPYHDKPPKISYIGETRKEAKRIAWDRAKLRTKPIWYKDPNETNLELYLKVNKTRPGSPEYSTIFFDGWENVNALIGEEFDFLVMDEVAKFRNFWTGWFNTLRPTLTPRRGAALFISRPQGLNHWYDLCQLQAKNEAFRTFYCTAYDNPFIAREEIEESRRDLPEDQFAQEYLGEFRKMQGLVYKEFSRSVSLFDDTTIRPQILEVIGGIDFGFTNPSVILKIEHDIENHYWLTVEWYHAGKTTPELIEQARTMGINIFYPDPAEPDRIEEMKRAGLNVREVSKDIERGIDSVRELFKAKRLHIHANCLQTIAELETYRYPDKKNADDNEAELPIKKKDHAMDALRYALYMNAPAFVEDESYDFGLYSASMN